MQTQLFIPGLEQFAVRFRGVVAAGWAFAVA